VPKRNAKILLLQRIPKSGCDFASAGSRKVKNSCDFASTGSRKNKEWPRPCFCRGSSAKIKCDLASTGDKHIKEELRLFFSTESKNKEWPRPCFCKGSSAKIKCDLASTGINISMKSYDFASSGSRKVKNGQALASAGDQVPNQM